MIFITGDVHGVVDIEQLSEKRFPEQQQLTRSDYVIVCGDFGCVCTGNEMDDRLLDWLEERSFTTLFVDGNHENYNALGSYSIDQWHGGSVHFIRPNVIHLMRGQVYEIDSHTFFTMGGAASADRDCRIEGRSWWPQEMPTEEEYAEAERNLARHNYTVDYIITHAAPCSLVPILLDPNAVPDRLTRFLDRLTRRVLYRHWYFGHLHIDKDILNFSAMYNRFVRLELSDVPERSTTDDGSAAEKEPPYSEDICEEPAEAEEAYEDDFISDGSVHTPDWLACTSKSTDDDYEEPAGTEPSGIYKSLISFSEEFNSHTSPPCEDEPVDFFANYTPPVIRGAITRMQCSRFTVRKDSAIHAFPARKTGAFEEDVINNKTVENIRVGKRAAVVSGEDDTDLSYPFFNRKNRKYSASLGTFYCDFSPHLFDGTGALDLTAIPTRFKLKKTSQPSDGGNKAPSTESASNSDNSSKTPFPLFLAYCAFSAIALIVIVSFLELNLGFLSFLEHSFMSSFVMEISHNDLRTYALGSYLCIVLAAALTVKKRSIKSAFNTALIPLLLGLSAAAVCVDSNLIKYALFFVALIIAFAVCWAVVDFNAKRYLYKANVRKRKSFPFLPAADKPSFFKCFIQNFREMPYYHIAAMLYLIVLFFVFNPLDSHIADDYIDPKEIVESSRPPCYITNIIPSNNVTLSYYNDNDPTTAQIAQFNHHCWNSLTTIERLSTLQAIINMEATTLQLPHAVSVECTRLNDGSSANYDSARRIITVSDDLLMGNDLSALLRSVLYQCRRAYQHDIIRAFYNGGASNVLTTLNNYHTYPLWLEAAATYASVNSDKSAAESMEHFAEQLDNDAAEYADIYLWRYLWLGSKLATIKGIAEEQSTKLPDGNSVVLHLYSDSIAVFRGTFNGRYKLLDIIRPESTITADEAASAIFQSLGTGISDISSITT